MAKAKCIVNGCKRASVLRGVCHNHYFSAYRAIRTGAIKSWLAASRQGLAVASKQKPGPKRS